MRPRIALTGWAAATLLLLLAQPAAAEGQFAFTAGIPVRFSGATVVEADQATLVTRAAPTGLLLDPAAHGRLVTFHTEYALLPDGKLVRAAHSVLEADQSIDGLRVTNTRPDYYLAATGDGATLASSAPPVRPEDVWTGANAQLSVLLHDYEIAPRPLVAVNDVAVASPQDDGGIRVPLGLHEARSSASTAEIGLDRLVVYDATLVTRAGSFESGRLVASAPGGVYAATGWTGPGEHLVEDLSVLVVDGAGTRLSLSASEVALYASDLLVRVDGLAQFAWAEGRMDAPDAPGGVSGEAILAGAFQMRALAINLERAPSVSWLGAGDFHLVALGAASEPTPAAVAATVAAGGAAAAGLFAFLYYWPALKYAATTLLMPLYARLPRDRVLEHKGRELVYDRIRQEPGISAHRLADTVDFGWSTLAYHLRVLEKTELVVSVRDGRYRRFFDRESGRYANGRKHLVAVLKNDQTLAIARAVMDAPGVTQKALAERFALSPSSVHWHVERLEAAGLLLRARDGHNVRYSPGAAWSEVDLADLGPAARVGPGALAPTPS